MKEQTARILADAAHAIGHAHGVVTGASSSWHNRLTRSHEAVAQPYFGDPGRGTHRNLLLGGEAQIEESAGARRWVRGDG